MFIQSTDTTEEIKKFANVILLKINIYNCLLIDILIAVNIELLQFLLKTKDKLTKLILPKS